MAVISAPTIFNDQKRHWKVAPTDAAGNPVTVALTWALTSDPALGTLAVDTDNMGAYTIPADGAVGLLRFTVADGGLTDEGQQPVDNRPPAVAALNLSFDPEEPK